jgi:SAM-dependent methyltransferase
VAFTDRRSLQSAAYADPAKLAARQAIYAYVDRPWPSDGGRVLGALGGIGRSLRDDELVVDVGCGNGNDARDLRRAGFTGTIVGADLSVGMLTSVDGVVSGAVQADAGALPLRDGAADVGLAMHMLYHCPSIEAAVAELRRVVRRAGGVLVVSTNSLDHLRELRAWWTAALSSVIGSPVSPWETAATRFSLEEGATVLAGSFDHVEVQRADNRLLVPDVEPVVAYVESTRDLSGAGLADDVWAAAIAELRRSLEVRLAADGALSLTVVKGVFVCR